MKFTLRRHVREKPTRTVGNGQEGWTALQHKHHGNTKEARSYVDDKLHTTTMGSGDDSRDFLFVMDDYRDCFEEVGQPVLDERYEDVFLQALPAECRRVRIARCKKRDVNLADIGIVINTVYTEYISRPTTASMIADHGVAMRVRVRIDGGKMNHITRLFSGKRRCPKRDRTTRNKCQAVTDGDKKIG